MGWWSVLLHQNLIRRRPSPFLSSVDALIGLVILPVGCAGLLAEAYLRTNLNDAQMAVECIFPDSNVCISNQHILVLQEKGIVVIDNVLSTERLLGIQQDIGHSNHTLQARYVLSDNDQDVRQDKIQWVRQQDTTTTIVCSVSEPKVPQETDTGSNTTKEEEDDELLHLNYAIALVRGIAHRLEDSCTVAKNTNNTTVAAALFARNLRVPRDCQLAVYNSGYNNNTTNDTNPNNSKDNNDNGTTTSAGGGYQRHLDRCTASYMELGLLEYWRLSDYQSRVITIILYLNDENRPDHHGGALRYWKVKSDDSDNTDDGETVDILPTGGKMVIFDASRIYHQVLPTYSERTALTCWVTGELVVDQHNPEPTQ